MHQLATVVVLERSGPLALNNGENDYTSYNLVRETGDQK